MIIDINDALNQIIAFLEVVPTKRWFTIARKLYELGPVHDPKWDQDFPQGEWLDLIKTHVLPRLSTLCRNRIREFYRRDIRFWQANTQAEKAPSMFICHSKEYAQQLLDLVRGTPRDLIPYLEGRKEQIQLLINKGVPFGRRMDLTNEYVGLSLILGRLYHFNVA